MPRSSKKPKPLSIVQVAPLWFAVPPHGYGGIERVVSMLTEGLVRRGHRVTLFAAKGSKTEAELISLCKPLIANGVPWSDILWNLRNGLQALRYAKDHQADILHFHLDMWGALIEDCTATPVVHTMHNPLRRDNANAARKNRTDTFAEHADHLRIAFVSKALRKNARMRLPYATSILNAVDTKHFSPQKRRGDHFIWIARMDKHKGVENALHLARELDVPLRLASRVDATKQEYFSTTIAPLLDAKRIFAGEKTLRELPKFYGEAKALLYPIEWDEPFGLVVAEAMACGTPVIAYKRGAMAEMIDHGVTGFLIKPGDEKGFKEAMRHVGDLDPKEVRRQAEKRFSIDRMVTEYENFYRKALV